MFKFKKSYLFIVAILICGIGVLSNKAEAKIVSVKGYYKPSSMKYVEPSYRTSPNKTKIDNYSTKGNYNPYTGKKGSVNIYKW